MLLVHLVDGVPWQLVHAVGSQQTQSTATSTGGLDLLLPQGLDDRLRHILDSVPEAPGEQETDGQEQEDQDNDGNLLRAHPLCLLLVVVVHRHWGQVLLCHAVVMHINPLCHTLDVDTRCHEPSVTINVLGIVARHHVGVEQGALPAGHRVGLAICAEIELGAIFRISIRLVRLDTNIS